jgi:hypothetical protein
VLPEGVCAEPVELNPMGALPGAQSTPVPDAPDGGAVRDSGPGVTDAGATDLLAGDARLPDAPAPATDAPAAPDTRPDAPSSDVPPGPCGFPDPAEPDNDTRALATRLDPGVPVLGCVADSTKDPDHFLIEAPAGDTAGGYYQIALTDVGELGRVGVTLYAASDNTVVLEPLASLNLGSSVFLHFSAAPGQRYRVLVNSGPDFKTPFRYTVTATYTKIDDPYEPNDSRAAAKPIAVGTPITAYLHAGFKTGHIIYDNGRIGPTATDDFYKVTLGPGMVTAVVDNAASDLRVVLTVYDGLGTQRGQADSSNGGAGARVMIPVMTPGDHYVLVSAFGNGPLSAAPGQTPSPSLTMPYQLTVTQ